MKYARMTGIYVLGIVALTLIMQGSYAVARNWNLVEPPKAERDLHKVVKELRYYQVASKINDYYYRFEQETRVKVIVDVLKALDVYLPRYFPKGPYTKKDLLAIAMVESGFNQFLTGKYDEYGVFQIMPESSKWAGVEKNQFDVTVNTEMALFVLSKKFEEHKDYKKAIIAYNGYVKRRGKVDETYWNKFIKYRRAIDDILREYGDNL